MRGAGDEKSGKETLQRLQVEYTGPLPRGKVLSEANSRAEVLLIGFKLGPVTDGAPKDATVSASRALLSASRMMLPESYAATGPCSGLGKGEPSLISIVWIRGSGSAMATWRADTRLGRPIWG